MASLVYNVADYILATQIGCLHLFFMLFFLRGGKPPHLKPFGFWRGVQSQVAVEVEFALGCDLVFGVGLVFAALPVFF